MWLNWLKYAIFLQLSKKAENVAATFQCLCSLVPCNTPVGVEVKGGIRMSVDCSSVEPDNGIMLKLL